MEKADFMAVFQRLGERGHRFLDERHQEMPLTEDQRKEPLFLCKSIAGQLDVVR